MEIPTFLMCEPTYFAVNYVINPWMAAHINNIDHARATKQWQAFYQRLSQFVTVHLITPQPQLPDFVFTANAALVKNKRCLLSHFRHPERQREEPCYQKWFTTHDYEMLKLPTEIFFEGEGDALFQPDDEWLWMGYGIRSNKEAYQHLSNFFHTVVVPLQLIDEKFYHLDTCFFPLRHGYVMYYPAAFDRYSNQMIEAQVPNEKRIAVSDEDAHHFACNAVFIPKHNHCGTIMMNYASDELQDQLTDLGYELIIQPVDEFMKAGGANKCLILTI